MKEKRCKYLLDAHIYLSPISIQYCTLKGNRRKKQTTPAICARCTDKKFEESNEDEYDYTKLRY